MSAVSTAPAVVVVEGEVGIGKTRLISELRARPEVADRRFLVGSCPGIREPFPLGPVLDLVKGLDHELAASVWSPLVGSLRPLLPEVAHLLPPQPASLDDRPAERHRVFRALMEVLASLGSAVVVLEDLHWADDHTIDFIAYLVADPPPKLSLVLTYREDEAAPHVRALTARLPESVTRSHLSLVPLDAQQTSELTSAILRVDRVSEEFAEHLCERASGVPFAIEELLALLQARGTLVQRDGGWQRKDLDELDVPTGIRDLVLERVGRLPDDARSVVEASAVLQTHVPVQVLVDTCRAAEHRVPHGLEQALESGLLVEVGTSVGFRHLLAAQAVYESLPGTRRQDLHSRAATSINALAEAPMGQVAHHLRHAGRPTEWADAAERAAGQAIDLGHHDEAARLLKEVLNHAPIDPLQRGRVAVQLGWAAANSLRPVQGVARLLRDVLNHELPQATRGELRLRLAILLEVSGEDFRLLRPLCAAAVDDLAGRPDLMAQAMLPLAFPGVPGVTLAEHKKWLQHILDIVPAVADPAWQTFLLGKVAMVQLTDRISRQVGGVPRQSAELGAFQSIGDDACFAGHLEDADRLLAAGLQGAIESENVRREMGIRAAEGLLDYLRGDWDGLAGRAKAMIEALTNFALSRSEVEIVAGCLALSRGDLDPAAESLEDLLTRLEQRGAFDVLPVPAAALIRHAVARGDVSSATRISRRFLATVESIPLPVSAFRALPAVTAAIAGDGQPREAQELVTRWARKVRGMDAPTARAALPHARGYVAAATRQPSIAAGQFLEAARQYDRLHCPYEAAHAREEAGASLLIAGDCREQERAEGLLRSAMMAYQRLGATWDVARTVRRARQHGISVRSGHRRGRRSYGTVLSPQEEKVAKLAATGLTNREIADAMFLSVNTIKRHVAAVLRKLELRSRADIAHQLAPPDHDGERIN